MPLVTFQTQADWQSGTLANLTATRVSGKILIDPTGTGAEQGAGWTPVFGMAGSGWTFNGGWSTPGNLSVAHNSAGNHGWVYRPLTTAQGRWESSYTFGFATNQTVWFHFFFNNVPPSLDNVSNFWGGYAVKFAYSQPSWPTTTLSLIRNDVNAVGSEVVLATTTFTDNTNPIYSPTVRVDRDATGLMHVYVNNILYLTATDLTYTSGTYVGFHHFSSGSNSGTVVGDNGGQDSQVPLSSNYNGTWTSPVFDSTATPSSWNPIIASYSPGSGTVTISTSSSPDNITYSPFVAATSNVTINSPLNRYLITQVAFSTPLNVSSEPQMSTLLLSSNLTGGPSSATAVFGDRIDPSISGSGIPAGTMIHFSGATPPTGFILCDGSVVSQTTYANLFSAIGSTWNTGGEGVGNFRLPDCRGRAHFGKTASGTFSTLGSSGGSETHTHTTQAHTHTTQPHRHDNGPSHTHTLTADGSHTHARGAAGDALNSTNDSQSGHGYTANAAGTALTDNPGTHNHTVNTGLISSDTLPSVTTDTATPGMSTVTSVVPYIAFNYCIKV